MRKLVMKMTMSLDGFVSGGGADSDWMLRASTPDSAAWVYDTIAGAGTLVIGRRSFEQWAKFWPTSESRMAPAMNGVPKAVFTRQALFDPAAVSVDRDSSGGPARWAAARVAGELVAEIARLKEEPGDYLLAQGGVDFCRSLIAADLVDEYRFAIAPVVIGTGESLFSGLGGEPDLDLVGSTAFAGGAIGNVYRPAGRRDG